MRTALEPIRVIAGNILRRTCREQACRKPIDLRLTDNGTWMPFARGAAPLHTEMDERHVRYELMSRDDLHFAVCAKRRAAAAPGAHA